MQLDELIQDFQVDNPPANWDKYDDTVFDSQAELVREWAAEGPENWSDDAAAFYNEISESNEPLAKLDLLATHLMGRDWSSARAAGGDAIRQLIRMIHGRAFDERVFREILSGISDVHDRLRKFKQSEQALRMTDEDVDALIHDVLDDDDSKQEEFSSPIRHINASAVLSAVREANSPELRAFRGQVSDIRDPELLRHLARADTGARIEPFGANYGVQKFIAENDSRDGLRHLYDYFSQDRDLVNDLKQDGISFVQIKYGGGNRFPRGYNLPGGHFDPHGLLRPGTTVYYRRERGPFQHFDVQTSSKYALALFAFLELAEQLDERGELADGDREQFPNLERLQSDEPRLWSKVKMRLEQYDEDEKVDEGPPQREDTERHPAAAAEERYPHSVGRESVPSTPRRLSLSLETPPTTAYRRRTTGLRRAMDRRSRSKVIDAILPPASRRRRPAGAPPPPRLKMGSVDRSVIHSVASRGSPDHVVLDMFPRDRAPAEHPSLDMPTPIRVRTGVRMRIPRVSYVAHHRRRRIPPVGPERDKAKMYDNVSRQMRPLAGRPEKTSRIGEFVTVEESGSRFHIEARAGITKGAARRLAQILLQHGKTNPDAKLNMLINGVEKHLGPLKTFSLKNLISIIVKSGHSEAVYIVQSELRGGALGSPFWTHPGLASILAR